jgi:hypothetical protein
VRFRRKLSSAQVNSRPASCEEQKERVASMALRTSGRRIPNVADWLASLIASALIALPLGTYGSAQTAPNADTLGIDGEVKDLAGGPLPGATVKLVSLSEPGVVFLRSTDRSGKYSIQAVPNGRYYLEVSLSGFLNVRYSPIYSRYSRPQTFNFDLPFDMNQFVADDYWPEFAELFGNVTLDGTELAWGKVCAEQNDVSRCCEANGLGHYRISVKPGRYSIVVYSKENAVLHREVMDLRAPIEYENPISVESPP